MRWRISVDGCHDSTYVVYDRKPPKAVLEFVEKVREASTTDCEPVLTVYTETTKKVGGWEEM